MDRRVFQPAPEEGERERILTDGEFAYMLNALLDGCGNAEYWEAITLDRGALRADRDRWRDAYNACVDRAMERAREEERDG